jgi:peptidoglycan/xylan/chitin deacetylase (PgdA/CDA1 family)
VRFLSAATLGPALTELVSRAGNAALAARSFPARVRRAASARSVRLHRRVVLPFLVRVRAVAASPCFSRSFLLARRAEALLLVGGLAAGGAGTVPSSRRFLAFSPWAPRRVALTFDDGPHPAYTGRLLDLLRAGGAHATFFVVGTQAEKNPKLLDDVLRRGCELANHTYDHPPLTRLRRADLLDELESTQALLDAAGARGPRFFRPPGGRFDGKVLATARADGYQMILWTVLPRDHEAPPKETVRRRVLEDVEDGGVILLHSGVESTAEALPDILADLRARGYACVSVGELLSSRRAGDNFESWLNPAALPRRPLAAARGGGIERPPEALVEP